MSSHKLHFCGIFMALCISNSTLIWKSTWSVKATTNKTKQTNKHNISQSCNTTFHFLFFFFLIKPRKLSKVAGSKLQVNCHGFGIYINLQILLLAHIHTTSGKWCVVALDDYRRRRRKIIRKLSSIIIVLWYYLLTIVLTIDPTKMI